MRTVMITETEVGIFASDTLGQFASAERNKQHVTYTSYLIDDVDVVQHTTAYTDNWRKQVVELMGF